MRDAGAAQTTSQAVVGHSDETTHRLYSHVDEDALRRAVYALPSFIDNVEVTEARMVEAGPIRKLVERLPNTKAVKPIKQELLALLKGEG